MIYDAVVEKGNKTNGIEVFIEKYCLTYMLHPPQFNYTVYAEQLPYSKMPQIPTLRDTFKLEFLRLEKA